ncbi:MAG: HEAT repeat domain-containing protein [Elusimicrobiota bacterium]
MTLLYALLILFGSQPLHAGAQACRKLRPVADRMRFDFPSSTPNQMTCGPGDPRPSNYVLPTDAESPHEMHVIGVYEGSFPPQSGKQGPDAAKSAVRVLVFKTRRPAIIVVSANKPVLWNFTVNQDADIELVVLQGRHPQSVQGLPADVPVLRRSYEESCGYGYGWERHYNLRGGHFRRMILSLRCATGLRETSFQGCMSGAVFEVPHYEQKAASYAGRERGLACPLPLTPDLLLPPDARPDRPFEGEAASIPQKRLPMPREPEAPALRPAKAGRAGRKPSTPGSREPGRAGPAAPVASDEPRLPGTAEPGPGMEGWPQELGDPGGPPEARGKTVTAEAMLEDSPRKAPEDGVKPHRRGGKPETLALPKGVPMRGDLSVRAFAILLEGNGTLLTHDAVPDLIEALEKGTTLLRWRAADALGTLIPPAEKAVKPLMRALKDPNPRVRSSAALALGNIGPASEKAARLLQKALKDENADVRYSAETALERIGTKKALKILRRHRGR